MTTAIDNEKTASVVDGDDPTALVAACRRDNFSDESMLELGRAVRDKPMVEMTNLEGAAWRLWERTQNVNGKG